MNNSITYLAIGIAIASISLSVILVSLNNAEISKIASLQEEIDELKNQLATPNGRGAVAQQSISKMTNLGSMNNDNINQEPVEKRLEKIESDIVDIRSKLSP